MTWADGRRPWLVVVNGPATDRGSKRENKGSRQDRESEEGDPEAEAREMLRKGVPVLDL